MYTCGVAGERITASQMVRALSENPARLFGMYPRKGTLAEGSDADLVIWDPKYAGCITAEKQLQNVDYTPYEGLETVGRAETVLLGGEVVVRDGVVVAEKRGRYVARGPSKFWR
jgi:dihydropyrimidinase